MTWSLLDRELTSTWSRFAEVFDELWNRGLGTTVARPAVPALAADTWVGPEDALVTFEVPGVDPSRIDVSVEGDTLTVKGERDLPAADEGERYHRRERFSGAFERAVEVPFRIDPQGVEARYENGVLEVRLPRAPEYRPRRIEVKTS